MPESFPGWSGGNVSRSVKRRVERADHVRNQESQTVLALNALCSGGGGLGNNGSSDVTEN